MATALPGLLTLAYTILPALADDAVVREPLFDSDAVRDFPQPIFDAITNQIARQTSFVLVRPGGLVRWWSQTAELVDFVRAPSPVYADTYLYAMRYEVPMLSDGNIDAAYRTSCQVIVVYKGGEYDKPLVVCEPVQLSRVGSAL